jgi:hypothetical protein
MKRAKTTKFDWFRALLFILACGSVWLWQYIKFRGQYGLFYRISPEYGAWILSISTLAIFMYCYFASIRFDKKLSRGVDPQ